MLGSCSATVVALGFLALAQYWQQLMWFLFALWLLFNKKHALWLIGFAPSGLVATSWGIKEPDLALSQVNSMHCWLLTAYCNWISIRHSKAVRYYMKLDRYNKHTFSEATITVQFTRYPLLTKEHLVSSYQMILSSLKRHEHIYYKKRQGLHQAGKLLAYIVILSPPLC